MLVFKTFTGVAPEGAEYLYRDALVTKGTMFCIDFSNTGTLDNFNVGAGAQIKDLAKEPASEMGIVTTGIATLTGDKVLTPGKGFNPYGLAKQRGLFFTGLMNYLVANQPHSLLIVWFRKNPASSATENQVIRTKNGTDYSVTNIRLNVSDTVAALSFGGSGVGNADATAAGLSKGQLMQFAVEFNGVGQPSRKFINGVDLGLREDNAPGFTAAESFMIANVDPGGNVADVAVYRMLAEDFDVSGRSAADVVKKDWDYVHGIGEFENAGERPFVDAY